MAISILSISPSNGSIGVDVQTEIKVMFDKPIDISSIGTGTLFIEGQDRDVPSGPEIPIHFEDNTHGYLQDPAYYGFVNGSYSLKFYDVFLNELPGTMLDTDGNTLYYSEVTFTPTKPLSPLHPYQLYIVGTSAANNLMGVHTRTIFDIIVDVNNTGDAKVFNSGAYKGTANGTFFLEIINPGIVGSANYQWKLNNNSWSPHYLTHTWDRHLKDGVNVRFGASGEFKSGDKFEFLVKPKEILSNVNISYFITGEQGIQFLPKDPDLLTSKAAPPFTGKGQQSFNLGHTIPYNISCDIDTSTTAFKFYFNRPIDPLTIDTNGFQVYIGPPDGDTRVRDEYIYTPNHIEVVDSTCLIVYLENT